MILRFLNLTSRNSLKYLTMKPSMTMPLRWSSYLRMPWSGPIRPRKGVGHVSMVVATRPTETEVIEVIEVPMAEHQGTLYREATKTAEATEATEEPEATKAIGEGQREECHSQSRLGQPVRRARKIVSH